MTMVPRQVRVRESPSCLCCFPRACSSKNQPVTGHVWVARPERPRSDFGPASSALDRQAQDGAQATCVSSGHQPPSGLDQVLQRSGAVGPWGPRRATPMLSESPRGGIRHP